MPGGRSFPWSISIAVLIIAGLVSVIAYNMVPKAIERTEAQKYAPSADNPDPSLSIEGVTEIEYAAGNHIQAPQRVAYDQTPPWEERTISTGRHAQASSTRSRYALRMRCIHSSTVRSGLPTTPTR
ncbi:hypothetical protein GCM10020255_011490 [Rhodococcus baikonurensis]